MGLSAPKLGVYDKFMLTLFFILNTKEIFEGKIIKISFWKTSVL